MTDTAEGNDQLKFHRIRFYEKAWSNFDTIELCTKPRPCLGCQFGHPFCDERGGGAKMEKDR